MSESHPEQVGDYVLGKTLGKGQYGKVKKAYHVRTKHEVAVKIIKRGKVLARDQAMLEREVRIHKLLRHPHVVTVLDFLEPDEGKTLYVICEYCPRGQIFDYVLAHGRLRETESRRFFRELVSAVDYCHSFGFVHRDIKLENILLDKDFHIKLTDFGFSRMFDSEHYLTTSCGSPLYASPEVLNGHQYRGPEVDMWSLGVVLYTFVVGAMPYMYDTPAALRSAINSGQRYAASPHLTGVCDALVNKLMTIDGKRRMRMTELLQDPWLLDEQSQPLVGHTPECAQLTPEEAQPEFLVELQRLGFSDADINRQLYSTESNQIRAIYRLIEQRDEHVNQRPRERHVSMVASEAAHAKGVIQRKRRNTITALQTSSAEPHSPKLAAVRDSPATGSPLTSPTSPTPPHAMPALLAGQVPRRRYSVNDGPSPLSTPPRISGQVPSELPGSPAGPSKDGMRRRGSIVGGGALRPIAEEPRGAGTSCVREGDLPTEEIPVFAQAFAAPPSELSSSPPMCCSPASEMSAPEFPHHIASRRTSTPEIRVRDRTGTPQQHPLGRRRFMSLGTTPALAPPSPIQELTTTAPLKGGVRGSSVDALPKINNNRSPRINASELRTRSPLATPELGHIMTLDLPDGAATEPPAVAMALTPSSATPAAGLSLEIARPPPRPARVPLSKATTSAKSPDELLAHIKDVLRRKGVAHDEPDDDVPGYNAYMLVCHHKGIEFEIEVCRVPRLSLHCLRFSLRSGDMWQYKDIHNSIVSALHL